MLSIGYCYRKQNGPKTLHLKLIKNNSSIATKPRLLYCGNYTQGRTIRILSKFPLNESLLSKFTFNQNILFILYMVVWQEFLNSK